ncbi:MAG: hypothetical protein INQ03_08100 [Candidatus Heimdallarchaeota archaeon]|nr:hypothetical protein [Candidatus Heimdallarchaeota archaeon]
MLDISSLLLESKIVGLQARILLDSRDTPLSTLSFYHDYWWVTFAPCLMCYMQDSFLPLAWWLCGIEIQISEKGIYVGIAL